MLNPIKLKIPLRHLLSKTLHSVNLKFPNASKTFNNTVSLRVNSLRDYKQEKGHITFFMEEKEVKFKGLEVYREKPLNEFVCEICNTEFDEGVKIETAFSVKNVCQTCYWKTDELADIDAINGENNG